MAYNVITTLWILSYHEFSWEHFGDFGLNIIELVSKVLDYFNKEKIVRIVCMLFDVSLIELIAVELKRKQRLPGTSLDD